MITKWGVKNFKSILEQELELAPLTVFTGVNSSGKSSFLHSIAMLAQAARSKAKGIITLEGDLIDLGSYEKIYHKNSIELKRPLTDMIGIDCTIKPKKDEDEYVRLELGLSGKGVKKLNIEQAIMEYMKNDKDAVFLKFKNSSDAIHEALPKAKLFKNDDRIELESSFSYVFDSFLPNSLCSYVYYQDCIDDFIALLCDLPTEELKEKKDAQEYADKKLSSLAFDKNIVEALLNICARQEWYACEEANNPIEPFNGLIPNFSTLFSDFCDNNLGYDDDIDYDIELADWYQVLSKLDKQKQMNIRKELSYGAHVAQYSFYAYLCEALEVHRWDLNIDLPPKLEEARDHLGNYFKFRIKYLKPLREDPQWEYTIDENYSLRKKLETDDEYDYRMRDIGVKGERTALVIYYLNEKQDRNKKYYPPNFFEESGYKEDESFFTALNEWLKYFIKCDYLKVKRNAIYIVIDGHEFSLPEVGTGISQILPILVMCLAAPVGSTLIIQEPEAHLHPSMQSKLADFFIAMALSGRQCLIETHSEYIIDCLRFHICQSLLNDNEEIKKNTNIYYCSIDKLKTEVTPIEINKYADYSVWPDGFFDVRQQNNRKILKSIDEKMLNEIDDADMEIDND
jgi:predicted ATPase